MVNDNPYIARAAKACLLKAGVIELMLEDRVIWTIAPTKFGTLREPTTESC